MQRPGRAAIVVAEHVGADRVRECRIVDQQRDVFAGLLSGAFPSGADLRARLIVHAVEDMHAILRCDQAFAFVRHDWGIASRTTTTSWLTGTDSDTAVGPRQKHAVTTVAITPNIVITSG